MLLATLGKFTGSAAPMSSPAGKGIPYHSISRSKRESLTELLIGATLAAHSFMITKRNPVSRIHGVGELWFPLSENQVVS